MWPGQKVISASRAIPAGHLARLCAEGHFAEALLPETWVKNWQNRQEGDRPADLDLPADGYQEPWGSTGGGGADNGQEKPGLLCVPMSGFQFYLQKIS